MKQAPAIHPMFSEFGQTTRKYRNQQTIFAQGDLADAIFYVCKGKVKVTILSKRAKEATIAILGAGDFLGEECLTQQAHRASSVVAEMLVRFLLKRRLQMEGDLVDQLFNTSEKRLARRLLLLANYGEGGKLEPIREKISQAMLAEMVGTTRSRINFFINKFKRLGFIEYRDGLHVNGTLLSEVLLD
jgi:CRP/FNR family transcriptional regulator, cyclic AMP receptor protein